MTHVTSRLVLAAALSIVAATGPGCATKRAESIGRYDEVPSAAYAIVAEVRAKPGRESELRAATLPLVPAVRGEPRNLLYFLHEDREVPGRFVFYEIFATQADFDAHNATPHVQAWFAKLPELAEGDVKVRRLQVLGN